MSIKEKHNSLCAGIDLGTTNSVAAIINEKRNGEIVSKVVDMPRPVDMYSVIGSDAKLTSEKKPTLPSCVYYRMEKNYKPLVGDFAKKQYALRPHLTAKSVKSQMGKPFVEGLDDQIPDKTPAEVSARILKHMVDEISKIYRNPVDDVVITVPANFDSAMCKATRDAAELAGIKVKNEDGSERPVLLSEPNAVIYDLINQIRNNEIPSDILDLENQKYVMVFDIGGGTLDITVHAIRHREDMPDVLKVDEIATNRYTLLGGDDFDEKIAETMYERYLKQYEKHPDALATLRKDKAIVMAQFRIYAEQLKLDLSERYGSDADSYEDSGWDDPDEDESFPIGGNMGSVAYAYDDTFTKEEIEEILADFMARELTYDDYKRIDTIKDRRNIIFPVLDVLKKAYDKLGENAFSVDAVIVNGGMSKFYMVTERLKEFFGFDPIVALDPDQAVARGAAVYHYYLHKYEELQEDMKLIGQTDDAVVSGKELRRVAADAGKAAPAAKSRPAIEWGRNILNDSLWLGVKNGGEDPEIVPTGAELPYESDVMTGFRVEPGQNLIAIPIKSRNLDGSLRVIAKGNISFKRKYNDGAYVSFRIFMGSNKVITMKAWTSSDLGGEHVLEEGSVEIAIDNSDCSKSKNKVIAPVGSVLKPVAEINNMIQLCMNYSKAKKGEKSLIARRISSTVTSIITAGNKEDFVPVILEKLRNCRCEEARLRLFTIARKIGSSFSEEDKKKLAKECMSQINSDLKGFSIGNGIKVNTNTQAIYTLGICADKKQLSELSALHDNPRYQHACIYTHGKTRTELGWLKAIVEEDSRRAVKGQSNMLQSSAYAIGMALRKDLESPVNDPDEAKLVKALCKAITSGNLTDDVLICVILALGLICDQRNDSSFLGVNTVLSTRSILHNIEDYYGIMTRMKVDKAVLVSLKMINGECLDQDDEEFLLTRLEV